ncbi:tetratricopeptide repeat protein [Anaeromyxobacter paludicola]|uniref:tetratricopeptide repeat protein n=1 Tax=Anaeromyxobacter paludicola TaxID=2918171 RepID=UPI0020BF89B0|nr:tetratricopeptide repeat protein [Anaeromyxobacter paludicola]
MGALLAAGAGSEVARADALKKYQADHVVPQKREIDDEAERAAVGDAQLHIERGSQMRDAGRMDEARAEWRVGGEQFQHLADRFRSSEWRLTYQRAALENFYRAGEWTLAADAADKLRADPTANDVSRAIASRFGAGALQQEAFAQIKAGGLEPLKIPGGKTALKPRPPPTVWRRFIDLADVYSQVHASDAQVKNAAEIAANFELLTGQVELSYHNVEEARQRLARIMDRFPGTPESADAAALYANSYLMTGDDAGRRTALEKARPAIHAALVKQQELAKSNPEAAQQAERISKMEEQLQKQEQQQGYAGAVAMLNAGKAAEAAQAFERYAADNKDDPDAAGALYNAGVAWDKAGNHKSAAAVREKLLADYPDSKLAPKAMLALASARSHAKEHGAAAKLYADYLAKYPKSEERCLALQNLGVETDLGGSKAEGARRYHDFASDPKCAAEDPNSAARLLYRAGALYAEAKQDQKAIEAWSQLSSLKGVTDTVAKSQVADAKAQIALAKARLKKAPKGK